MNVSVFKECAHFVPQSEETLVSFLATTLLMG